MASNYDPHGDAPTITRRRNVLACARCRVRRVKCDRAQPACSNCTKAGALCQPAQQTTPPHAALPHRTRESTNRNRIFRLEEQVARLSREVDSASPSRESSLDRSLIDSNEPTGPERMGTILKGREKGYLSPFSWAIATGEVLIQAQPSIFPANRILSSPTPESNSTVPRSSDVLFSEHTGSNLPNEELHETLLLLFSTRVDPFVRVLHWPSFAGKSAVLRSKTQKRSLHQGGAYMGTYFPALPQSGRYRSPRVGPTSTEAASTGPRISNPAHNSAFLALLYAVYFAAVISVVDGPNPHELRNYSAFELLATFEREIKKRVVYPDEDLVHLDSIEFIQATTILLSLSPSSLSLRRQWSILGTAVQRARALGLHRDGSNFGFGPIEIETRRRIWARLCVLDVRLAETLCRETTITAHAYDTALPLSISDEELSKMDEHEVALIQHQGNASTAHQNMEQQQDRNMPFSAMTLSLIETEMARLQQNLHAAQYHPRDGIFHHDHPSPQTMRRNAPPITYQEDRTFWISKLDHRLRSIYRLGPTDSPSFLPPLVAEIMDLALDKARFVVRLMEQRETFNDIGEPDADEFVGIFREAVDLSTRGLAFIHQYHNTVYSWYTKRFREPWSSSFLALILASRQEISEQDANAAWSVLNQLYPVDSAGRMAERNISESLLGKALSQFRLQQSQHFRDLGARSAGDHNLHPDIRSGLVAGITSQNAANAPANTGGQAAIPYPNHIFQGLDLIDPLWPARMEGEDTTNYGNWE
ncbi:hypothetical protein BS50DRAFT_589758 [Corynespora cassiicola Philippines]|uniref:Zn(2)-C6 fungal-type domain-containing protein n=1 Tax=Corynespora cassiicola Philippines TaxID=1448308 RepID=A0A2T2NJB8_CORCC|nr:hypothetical protein BS50DRAFT_589758 [Corynespora cassiicola Philippines]